MVTTETGLIELETPRDWEETFNPQLRRFPGFNDKIISMYGRR